MKTKTSKAIKKLLSIILCLALMIGFTLSNFSVIASAGSCGDNVTWVMSGLYTLIIDGSGDMDDFVPYYNQPWYEYASRITSVIIRDGVTSIGNSAFKYLINLTDISMADSVTEIGSDAFGYCESLSYIKLPENLTKINSYAFFFCKQLDDVIIPESVTTIGSYAFDSCYELSGINIPKNVVSIGTCAFQNCKALQAINVDVENKYFESDAQGVLFSTGKVNLIQYPLGSPTAEYDIPSGVKVLKEASFFSSKNLENITIPESVNTIEKEAFARSVALVSVTIPKSVQNMGDMIFYSCEALESVIIYAEITELPTSTFFESAKLKMVVLPPSMKVIKNDAFFNCSSLTGIVIPKSVETIEDEAFGRCVSLENVYYLGTVEQWSAVTITEPEIADYGNKYLVDATIHYCRETEKVDSNCTNLGKQSGIYCDECQEYVFGGEEIPISPDKHNYQNGKCSYCGLMDLPVKNAEGYYEIGNLGSFISFAEQFNSGNLGSTVNAILTADIDLEGFSWIPIGKASTKYKGVFDGQGHTISNFNMTITGAGNWGLFGYATGEGTVIKNFSISGDVTTALTSNVDVQYGVVGQADGTAEIRNVHSSVNLTSEDAYQKKYFGGIVGRTGNITVDMCSYSGKLSLGSNTLDCVGGIVGYVYNGKTAKINNCGFYGNIESAYSGGNVGGILGYYNGENAKALTISNCLSIGALPSGRGAVIGTINNYGSTNAGSNNYYLDGLAHSVTNITANSASQKNIENGRIAYYLQSNNTEQVWGQDIDNGKPRQYVPTINAGKLYKVTVCGGDTGYSNSSETNGHNFIDYKCVFCGMYTQPPKADTYYLISNIGHLLWWQQAINEAGDNEMYVKLVADIDLNPGYVFNEDGTVLYNGEPVTSGWYEWTPMGTEEEPSGGDFLGNNHTISGIYINSDIDHAGFFGVTYNANIKGFNISNAYIKGKTSAGGLCGKAMYSKITNCVSNATVSAENNAGGICGEIYQTNFYQCGNNGNIDGYYAGGICGYEPMGELGKVYFGYMENCYNTGDITGESYAGGLFGFRIDTQCYNCFNIGKVTSDANAYDISSFHFNNQNSYYLSETETEDGGKTVEQFASGEVAYLLQQGNTEQVWGQMSNTEGSLPIITDNELYKVVTVGGTGNYSVANVGDTNGDGTVDINDYQAMVNTVASGGHAQSETESYDDIIKYDLNGDGYVDALDATLMNLLINGLTTVDVYAVGDYDLNGIAFEEADIKAIKHAIENPEKLAKSDRSHVVL